MSGRSVTVSICVALGCGVGLSAEDWPQWRGAGRVGVWTETGIVDELPDELTVKWRAPVNSGYSGPAVADGRVFITDWVEDSESRTMDGIERVLALDEATGAVIWSHEWSTSYRMLQSSYAIGPRATPTIDDDRVYVVGATGRLLSLDVATGDVIWHKDFVEDYGTSVPTWGTTSAPLVDGQRLITLVGGEPGALVMAFDKRTGEELWRSLEVVGEMGYAQPVIYEAGGVRQLIIWHPAALASLDPVTGDVYWEEPWEVGVGATVATPVRSGNYLLVTQYSYGSMMMQLSTDRADATMMWKGQSRSELPDQTDGLHSLITTPVISGDQIYGVGSYGELRGLDARTGERLWMSPEITPQERWAAAIIVQHGDRYFVNNEEGFLIMARFTPSGYVELGRTRLIEVTGRSDRDGETTAYLRRSGRRPRRGNSYDRPVNWSHPAYANRHIFQRNERELIRASLAAVDYQ